MLPIVTGRTQVIHQKTGGRELGGNAQSHSSPRKQLPVALPDKDDINLQPLKRTICCPVGSIVERVNRKG